jgi:SAM-dependent methyltransferase
LTRRACPACGGLLRGWRPAKPLDGGGPVFLLRCVACGTAATAAPAPADAHDTGAYASASPRLAGVAAPVLASFDRARLRLLRSVAPPPARLLDVGAGRGRFVAAACAAGYDAAGIDPSARGVRAARSAYGVSLVPETIAEHDDAGLDAVTLWHVLEHVDEPGAALSRIASWLRPGGALVVGVPNVDSLQARVGGAGWYHLDVPRHRTHFTPRGLETLLAASGFEVVRVRHVLAEHNAFGMWQSAVSRVTSEPSYAFRLLKRSAPARPRDLAVTAAAAPLAPVAAAAELAAGAARRGGTIAVLARRR